jgi:hypothetical protein
VLQSPQCTHYQQLARFLDASRLTVTEKIDAGNGNYALLLTVLAEEISEAAPSPSSSPPGSYVFSRSAPAFLRI